MSMDLTRHLLHVVDVVVSVVGLLLSDDPDELAARLVALGLTPAVALDELARVVLGGVDFSARRLRFSRWASS
jgi:hypothetical protein